MKRWAGALKGSPKERLSHSSIVQVSDVKMRFVLMGESGNSHMLVLKSRPLRRNAWKPKQWMRLGPKGLLVPFFLWGYQSTSLSAGRFSDGLRLLLFVLGSHKYWDGLRDFGGLSY